MGILLIIPILAFDVWLALTTGKRAFREIMAARKYLKLGAIIIVGVAVAFWFTFFVDYKMGQRLKIASFPIPCAIYHLENGNWVDSIIPQPFLFLSMMANILTGLIVPLIPLKIGEFLKTVKQELR